MPELPDVEIYCEALSRFFVGRTVASVELRSPFLVRTAEPDIFAAEGRVVRDFRRLGKRIVWDFGDELYLVLHLMIAGRLHRKRQAGRLRAKSDLAAFRFDTQDESVETLLITEASTKKRASVHMVASASQLAEFDRGGIEPLTCSLEQFRERVLAENHTLKRCLTDPRLMSGIGNAYSDEILHRAQLSPVQLSSRLDDRVLPRLYEATRATLGEWTDRLRSEVGDGFPERVTAFHPKMAVHGRYGQPCPVCQTIVQRIRYASNETNYCPRCQTGGKLLADRSLSRLLKGDWPRSIDEWESLQ